MSAAYRFSLNTGLKTHFVFDENNCVACQACVLACMFENQTGTDMLWRQVHSQQTEKPSDLPIFHLSLACNHCEDAPCMNNCPALAYERDVLSGAVLHMADKCIGCAYCTWACPYDAPKFNEQTKIVEKCNFCVDRLHENLKPACVTSCPTGALDVSQSEKINYDIQKPFFEDFGIKPSIKVLPLNKNRLITENWEQIEILELPEQKETRQISFKKEYPLAIFSFLMAFLSGIWGRMTDNTDLLSSLIFIGLLVTAFALSSLHLGKPLRAWRAVLNVKSSWLSREILFSGMFAVGSLIYLLLYKNDYLALFTQIMAFIALFSIDKVYSLTPYQSEFKIHSAWVSLSGLLFWLLAKEYFIGFYILLTVKLLFFTLRTLEHHYLKKRILKYLAIIRLVLLISVFFIQFEQINVMLIYVFLFISEFIDRAIFYEEIDSVHFKL